MSEDNPPLSVLRRKAGARPGPPPPPRGMSPEKALLQALTKSGEGLPGLNLLVHDQTTSIVDQTELLAQLPEIALFTLADGPGDSRGLICFGPELVDALIEVQTMGRVERSARAPRATTRIDAALTRDFVETVLTDFAARVSVVTDARWARGYKYGTYVPDPAPLSLMLEEGDYRLQMLTVELGGGAKTSKVWLALPSVAATVTPPAPTVAPGSTAPEQAPKPRGPADPVWTAKLEAAASAAPVELRVTLTRFSVPLGRLQSFAVGDMIPISRGALSALEITGAGHGYVLKGRLGQQNGMRAVRLAITGPAQEGVHTAPPPAPDHTPPPPAMPPLPDPGALPDLPSLGDTPSADLPDMPSLPDLPDTGAATGHGLPDLPDLPPLDATPGGLPDLPDLPMPGEAAANGLPDLPDLPELPDLPDLPAIE